ncbi:glycosyltransferase [Paenibacillus sp. FSL H8-0260]|uniref:tetratricopeptide repeat-containing glycosyltransferase family 2 protein n=1 Tax=Paenibacillus sp. FSL H8-0260 TaxID=2921380 RepID=UPI003248B54C
MTTPDITLCMIIKNEANHLEKCLSSVRGLVSEIIIADTGSEDNSKEIAQRFGAKIIDIPWENDFSKARNISLEYATSAWVLVLDADEAVDHWSEELLQPLLGAEYIHGYWLPIIHYVGEIPEADFVTDHVCRLFKNDKRIIFRGSIHEEIASSIWELPAGEIAYADLRIFHYGYLEDELLRKNKYNRNLALINRGLRLQPNHLFLRYALGAEYYQQGQYKEAAEILLPLLTDAPAPSGYVSDIYLKTAYALQLCGRKQEAEEVFRMGSGLFPDFTDLLESYALLLLEQGKLSSAKHFLENALQSGNTAHKYPSSSGSGTYRTELLAGRVCEKLYQYPDAWRHYEAAIQHKPDYSEAWKELIPLSLLSGEKAQLRALTHNHLHSLSPDTLSYLLPAALNARDPEWQAELSTASQLPSSVQAALQAILEINNQPEHLQTLAPLEQLLHDPSHLSNRSFVLGYLWAFSCRIGDTESAMRWLVCLLPYRPGILSIHHILAGNYSLKADLSDLSYAAQLLLQTGAWNSLLALYRHSEGSSLHWSSLPQPLLYGLLEAPTSIKKQWCSIYVSKHPQYHTPADCTEWQLYAAIAYSCGEMPILHVEDEAALRRVGGATAAVSLAYYKLQLAAEVYPQGIPSAHIPSALLLRSASRT